MLSNVAPLLFLTAAALSPGLATQCLSGDGISLSFSATTNSSDHEVIQTQLDHPTNQRNWTMDFVILPTDCSENEAVRKRLIITITSQREGERSGKSISDIRNAIATSYTIVRGAGLFKLHTYALPWDEAKKSCEEEGAYLAIPNSELEAKALMGMLLAAKKNISNTAHTNIAHLGIRDGPVKDTYISIFGQQLEDLGYSQWAHGQPASRTDGCVALWEDGKYVHEPRKYKFAYFCEMPL